MTADRDRAALVAEVNGRPIYRMFEVGVTDADTAQALTGPFETLEAAIREAEKRPPPAHPAPESA